MQQKAKVNSAILGLIWSLNELMQLNIFSCYDIVSRSHSLFYVTRQWDSYGVFFGHFHGSLMSTSRTADLFKDPNFSGIHEKLHLIRRSKLVNGTFFDQTTNGTWLVHFNGFVLKLWYLFEITEHVMRWQNTKKKKV